MIFWKGHPKKHWRNPGVLFFKEIMDEKLDNKVFSQFYQKECHLCSTTMKVIAGLEDAKEPLPDILARFDISRKAYEDLKDAENCDPKIVEQLCCYLGIKEPRLFENCQKLK